MFSDASAAAVENHRRRLKTFGDALALALMQLRGFDAEAFAHNHPGGSLGKRLNLRVADVMHHGDAVATVTSLASMDEVVVAATHRPLGGVLVVEGTQLLGIIGVGSLALSVTESATDVSGITTGG